MSHKFIIGARKSALARLQAYHVAQALKRRHPHLKIEFYFQEASGDKDLTTPLWQMPDKGVFTRDLTEALLSGKVDFVIHSHKDLETEPTKGTLVLSVLPRADARDLLLWKKSWLARAIEDRKASQGGKGSNEVLKKITIYTSSPRRKYNLPDFLARALPTDLRPQGFVFEAIRGNIQTRLRKFWELPGGGFVIAKAALDRILKEDFPESRESEFCEIRAQIRSILSECIPMVLPLSQNPCAPAQGAFALEMREEDERVWHLARGLLHRMTKEAVGIERRILASYGGGCHQKIGASHLPLGKYSVTFVRGLTDAGEALDTAVLRDSSGKDLAGKASEWPPPDWEAPDQPSAFWKPIEASNPPKNLYGEMVEGITQLHVSQQGFLASAMVADWFLAAEKNVWVHASADGLGWPHAPELSFFADRAAQLL